MVVADGRFRRAGAAVADDRPMPQRRLRLDGSRIAICETSASIPLDAIRRPRDTPIWKLEGSFRCLRNASIQATGAPDQADPRARGHALRLGASGR
jgi:hypothetical protein